MDTLMAKTRIGIVGAGEISNAYLQNISKIFQELEVSGICDLNLEKARQVAKQHNVKFCAYMRELLDDPTLAIVLSLTPAGAHYGVCRAALKAGKHVYIEQPFAATFKQGKELAVLAQERGLVLGGGPDAFLGAAVQGSRRLLEADVIGKPLGASARIVGGGEALLEKGPGYVTALVHFFGPVKSVVGVASPAEQLVLLRFQSGETATLACNAFSMPLSNSLVVYGARGNMIVPDPYGFGGEIKIKIGEPGTPEAQENWGHGQWIPIDSPYDIYQENSVGLGLADLAKAVQTGRTPRAAAPLPLHVLEVLTAAARSSEEGGEITLETTFAPQPPLSFRAVQGILD
jgi:predicted dehydrogenase